MKASCLFLFYAYKLTLTTKLVIVNYTLYYRIIDDIIIISNKIDYLT